MSVERSMQPRTSRLVRWLGGLLIVASLTMLTASYLVRSGGPEAYGYSAPILQAVSTLFK